MAPSIVDPPKHESSASTHHSKMRYAQLKSAVSSKSTLENAIRSHELVPLWNTGAPPAVHEPRSKHLPALWKYEDTKALLLRAADLVDSREAERRAVLMINPGPRQAPFTLDTILAAHQLLIPGEKAVCHRHSPFAVRFLIEGDAGYTAISGKKMYMSPGDLIITPVWNWHDHGNEGTNNVIWLDGLNIPFFKHVPVDFTEHYDEMYGLDTHPSEPPINKAEIADMKFPYTEMRTRLNAAGGDFATCEYLKPDGKSVSSIIGAYMTRIRPGKCVPPAQDTTSTIFQVHRGSGFTRVWKSPLGSPKDWVEGCEDQEGKDTYTLRWTQGDSFCIPVWYRYQIFADMKEDDSGDGSSDAYLFSFSDKPMQIALGIWQRRI